jgi:hypothetical protein
VDGLQLAVGQQPADELRFQHVAGSRDGVLLHESRPADAVHSPNATRFLNEAMLLDGEGFLAEAYFHFEQRSPPAGLCLRDAAHSLSLKRSVAEVHHCVLLECYVAPCLVE